MVVTKIFKRLVNLGASHLSSHQKKITRLTNIIALLLMIAALPYSAIFYFSGESLASLIVLPCVISYTVILLLNYFKKNNMARIYTVLISLVIVGVYTSLLGFSSGAYLIFFPLSVLPVIFFDDLKLMFSLVGVTVFSMLVYLASEQYEFVISGLESPFSIIYYFACTTTFILIVLSVFFFYYSEKQNRESLIALNLQLLENNKILLDKTMALQKAALEIRLKDQKASQVEAIRDIQANFLPKIDDFSWGNTNYSIDTIFRPSELVICGDFYDLAKNETHLKGIVGDIQGKGAKAGFIAVYYLSFFQLYKDMNFPPEEMATIINENICNLSFDQKYCAAFIWDLNLETRELRYTHAGLEHCYVLREKSIIPLKEGGLLLGLDNEANYAQGRITLNENDIFFLSSDGLTDMKNKEGERYGVVSLQQLLLNLSKKNSSGIKDAIKNEITIFSSVNDTIDDISVFTLSLISSN
jgi:serine phosphatase RsbU (regulator of sigma subunit)